MSASFDANALAALHAVCFSYPRPWSAAEFTALNNDPSTLLLLKPNGFLAGRVIADEAEILTLAVAPSARRCGIGRALIQEFHDKAKARAACEVFLEVAHDNDAAVQLYLAAGYQQAGLRAGYYRNSDGHAVDALILRHVL